MIVVGIDPGKGGAIAALDSYGVLLTVDDMPVTGKVVNGALVNELLGNHATTARYNLLGDTEPVVVIEDVHSMPKQGVASSFSFGRSLGVVEGVALGRGCSVRYVSPARWKRALGLTADKGASRRRATELWPTKAALFARVKDDGRAEAALIAHWWLTHGDGRSS